MNAATPPLSFETSRKTRGPCDHGCATWNYGCAVGEHRHHTPSLPGPGLILGNLPDLRQSIRLDTSTERGRLVRIEFRSIDTLPHNVRLRDVPYKRHLRDDRASEDGPPSELCSRWTTHHWHMSYHRHRREGRMVEIGSRTTRQLWPIRRKRVHLRTTRNDPSVGAPHCQYPHDGYNDRIATPPQNLRTTTGAATGTTRYAHLVPRPPITSAGGLLFKFKVFRYYFIKITA